ncbi:MAG: pentapeptide repeat-containing protein [Burkholderiales bacterium]
MAASGIKFYLAIYQQTLIKTEMELLFMKNVSLNLPFNVKTISETQVTKDDKPQILQSLQEYITSYISNNITNLCLTTNDEKSEFITQCSTACLLATDVVQNAKNHNGIVSTPELAKYGILNHPEAIKLFNILSGVYKGEENTPESIAASNLDKLCKHRFTVFKNTKLSFWGINYTRHANDFRDLATSNKLIDSVNSNSNITDSINISGDIRNKKTVVNLSYQGKKFNREVIASNTIFEGSTNFSGCEFQNINFDGVKFLATQDDDVFDFSNTTFHCEVDFSRATFWGLPGRPKPKIDFRNARISGNLRFGILAGGAEKYSGFELDLRGAQLLNNGCIQFGCDSGRYTIGNCILRMDRSQLRYTRELENVAIHIFAYHTIVFIDDKQVKKDELIAMIKEEKEKHNMDKYYYSEGYGGWKH